MKLLVVGLTLLFVSYSHQEDEEIAKFIQSREKCLKESGIAEPDLDQDDVFEKNKDNQPFKCFLKCIMVSLGSMSDDGEFMEDISKKLNFDIPQATWNKIVDNCKALKGKDACETAYLISACIQDDPDYPDN